MSEDAKFETWAIVELMGHVSYAGLVSEQTIAGTGVLRIDVPDCERVPAFTKYHGMGALYGITPCTEEVARAMAERFSVRPASMLALPASGAFPAPGYYEDEEPDDGDDEFEEDDEDECEELPDEAHLVPAGERGSAGRARPTDG